MSFNLLNIASNGIRASSELLNTTSKNITNVNTAGYVRERTEHGGTIDNQIGRSETYRLLNEFAQQQLNRDTSNRAFFERFTADAGRVDTMFSEESTSLSTQINNVFNNLQEALNQPANSTTRSLFFSNAQGFVDQLHTLSGTLSEQQQTVNDQLYSLSQEANGLIGKISELNSKIAAVHGRDSQASASNLYNERDLAIKELSELVNIETTDGPHGEKLVFMSSGESLVMENGTFNMFSLQGDPDPSKMELKLDVQDGKAIAIDIDPNTLKGEIGGVLAYRDEILIPAQTQLGQMALSFADAFNQQNRLGMAGNGELGGDLFTLPSVVGLAHGNSNAELSATLAPGQGSNIPASDFRLEFTGPSANDVLVQPIDASGKAIGTASAATIAVNGDVDFGGNDSFGLQINVSTLGAIGDKVDIKLNSAAASQLTLATDQGEHLALASPIRTETNINNNSEASISAGSVTSIGAGFLPGPPPSLANGELTLTKVAEPDQYTLSDSANSVTFTMSDPKDNILAQAGAPFDNYGFDFDIKGTPEVGDSFSVEFNDQGFDDNRNGQALAGLQNQNLVRQSVNAQNDGSNGKTFNQAYAGTVSDIGMVTAQAQTSFGAFSALEAQSNAWYESLSGVNLDEEAANLLRFQQSYSASARILQTAQTVFDTLLSSAR